MQEIILDVVYYKIKIMHYFSTKKLILFKDIINNVFLTTHINNITNPSINEN